MDNQIKILASKDNYAKHLITIPGISYYAERHVGLFIEINIVLFPPFTISPTTEMTVALSSGALEHPLLVTAFICGGRV